MQGLITEYALHVCDVVDRGFMGGNLFLPCKSTHPKTRAYEMRTMRFVVRAMRQLKFIVNHRTIEHPYLEEVEDNFCQTLRAEAKKGNILSFNKEFSISHHIAPLKKTQPRLEAIRERVSQFYNESKEEEE